MEIDKIIKLQIIPTSGYELEPDQLAPIGKWNPTSNGRYECSCLVKDAIGMIIRMRRQAATKYTIMVLSNNGMWGITKGSGSYEESSEPEIGAIPNAGYKFTQWQDGNTNNPRRIQVVGNMNYIANFEPEQITYTVQVIVKSGQENMGTVSGGGTGLEPGSTINIQAIPNPGNVFVRWNDGNTLPERRDLQVNSDRTYIAEFKTERYTITVKPDNPAQGSVTGGGEFPAGDHIIIKAIANTGYQFASWNDGNNEPEREIEVTKNETYTAKFEKTSSASVIITIKTNDAEMGYTIPASDKPCNIGEKLTIKAIPYPGFRFVKWNDEITDTGREIIVSGNATYIAIFAKDDGETPNENPDGNGEINNSPGSESDSE